MKGKKEMNKPGPTAAREAELRGFGTDKAPLSKVRLQELFDHHRWLASEGRFGRQLTIRQGFTAIRKDFGNKALDGVDFSRVNFRNVMFVLCSLKKAKFAGAQLNNVDFHGCELADADFRGTELREVSFEESNHMEARFDADTVWSLSTSGTAISYHKPANSPKI